jgi:HPt (histidine-containing phosphotransfer) domain-containing protein
MNSTLTSQPMSIPANDLPASGLPGAGVLDARSLAALQQLDPDGAGGLVARILATYTQSLSRLLDQLGTARAAGDSVAMRHVVHTLKSSSASVGALQLSQMCADIESKLRDGESSGLDPQLNALSDEGARVLQALSPPT